MLVETMTLDEVLHLLKEDLPKDTVLNSKFDSRIINYK